MTTEIISSWTLTAISWHMQVLNLAWEYQDNADINSDSYCVYSAEGIESMHNGYLLSS